MYDRQLIFQHDRHAPLAWAWKRRDVLGDAIQHALKIIRGLAVSLEPKRRCEAIYVRPHQVLYPFGIADLEGEIMRDLIIQ